MLIENLVKDYDTFYKIFTRLSGMKIVTGAEGFIGSNLVAGLEAAGEDIAVCDTFHDTSKRDNLSKRDIKNTIRSEELFNFLSGHTKNIETIFLLGAISSTTETNTKLLEKINVDLPKKIWAWCKNNHVKLIYASSAATYGDGSRGFDDNLSLADLKKLQPLNAYAQSKHEFDLFISSDQLDHNDSSAQWAGLKFFNVYGPNEYHKKSQMSVIPQFFNQIITTGKASLFQSHNSKYSDGGQLRDFIWVEDCVRVMMWFDKNLSSSGLYNCGTGNARSFLDLAKLVFSAMDKEENIEYIPTPEAIRDKYQYFTQANMDKLKSLGYDMNFTTLENGVTQYVRDYLMGDDQFL